MKTILGTYPLNFVWDTDDPFLFCAHHLDYYPEGDDSMGPKVSTRGRQIGQDFDMSNTWRMYHGEHVPGFPEHPHRGFETVTVTLDGLIDHFDSVGASGRYGFGDVQWMTAGKGCQHSEMFPLVNSDGPNTLHLFQIWLNLPSYSKFVEPNYKMIWKEELKKIEPADGVKMTIIAGTFSGTKAIDPTPDSWASDPEHKVDIFLVEMGPGSQFDLLNTSDTVNRNIYIYEGTTLQLNGEKVTANHRVKLGNIDTTIYNTGSTAKLLVLQGEPINEPVAKYGPFVMNTQNEIHQAFSDYQKTQFGGWPWDRSDPVFPREGGRVAKYKDGSVSYPPN